jgi:very-long-chain enoyl-CoA reductase
LNELETRWGEMMWPSASPFLYPPSAFVAAASLLTVVSLASLGLAELRGEHVAYSKFWHVVAAGGGAGAGRRGGGVLLQSRAGMLVSYVPALIAALASFAVPGAADGARAQLLRASLAVHFLKRILEVTMKSTFFFTVFCCRPCRKYVQQFRTKWTL